ncbi:Site-specific recombinase XerD [Ruminococcaceae bacterium YRB3002]|nr:Site-specific recombinase XerD [Ruminococcaceae bacterium YRB3002]
MAKVRKDLRGRILRKGEIQRASDKRYVYTYNDPLGRRKSVYAYDLVTLREKEKDLQRDQLDGLDIYVAGKATVNETFDRYISLKYNLKSTTKSNYTYMYDRFVRDTFGRKLMKDIRYSDVIQYYGTMLEEQGISLRTVDAIHSLLHPTFQLAVRDGIIRVNPTDGVMKTIKANWKDGHIPRHALTREQQRELMEYVANHPVYYHWWPILTVLLGTGCRIGEALGLRWEDIDYDNRTISVNHSLVYYPDAESRKSELRVSLPKTQSGIRTIPMMDIVYDAFKTAEDEQSENGSCVSEIDGMKDFIFTNRFGLVLNPPSVNRAIKRIIHSHNAEELVDAKRERRKPILLPDFSCHHLRHTFCTRLCETETNLKVIQSIMGHKDIQTTMDVYAEATESSKQTTIEKLSQLNIF